MKPLTFGFALFIFLLVSTHADTISNPAVQAQIPTVIHWPAPLPVYDHVVIVIEENKGYEEVINSPDAPYINGTLKKEGADLTQMYAEEHHSEGNYFWLLSGSNQNVGSLDLIPSELIPANNLGAELIRTGRSFKGYSEDLPTIGSSVTNFGLYARKHVPWISFSNLPNGTTPANSSNLRFQDFPQDYSRLPTVCFVIPNLINDMHDGEMSESIRAGDVWLRDHLDRYYQWAKQHNSLLILTFDENSKSDTGLTNPSAATPADRNRIPTILAGAHIKAGEYLEGKGVTHVNILRTLEAMYQLTQSGRQQSYALRAGITDDYIITDLFEAAR